jgi:acyl-CoA hydrolase
MATTLALNELDFATLIRPGDTVTWGQATAEPTPLTGLLMDQRHSIGPFSVFVGISHSTTVDPLNADIVRFRGYCGAGENRRLIETGLLDIVPSHYSDMAGRLPEQIDVLLLQLAEAEGEQGYSLGLAHEYLVPLIDTARIVVAEVNDQLPWTMGERVLFENDIDVLIRTSRPMMEISVPPPGPVELAIARRVAELIEDGSTLQVGLGALPKAVLAQLVGHSDIGIHSGVIGDEVVELVEAGVVTNARKTIDPRVSVAGLLIGSHRLYDFAHRNRSLAMRSTAYTHCPSILERIDRFVAVNSAIEVDLTGQINAEMARGTYVGAVGGAVDFLRGAHLSKGGLPIIALPSNAGHGERAVSRIVSRLLGPVSTTRSDAGIIVTEHGVADLRGLSISQRIQRMLDLADPAFRDALERDVRMNGGLI